MKTNTLYIVTASRDFIVVKYVIEYGITRNSQSFYYDVLEDDCVQSRQFIHKDGVLYIGDDKQFFDQLRGE